MPSESTPSGCIVDPHTGSAQALDDFMSECAVTVTAGRIRHGYAFAYITAGDEYGPVITGSVREIFDAIDELTADGCE